MLLDCVKAAYDPDSTVIACVPVPANKKSGWTNEAMQKYWERARFQWAGDSMVWVRTVTVNNA